MAKKKSTEEVEVPDIISRVCGKIDKKQFLTGNSLVELEKKVIPFSPALDIITGGGIQEGGIIAVTGPEKFGKTLATLSFAATAQKPEYGSRNVWHLPIEGRLQPRDIAGIEGLDTSKFYVPLSSEDKILSAEEYLEIAKNIVFEDPGAVIIIDSLSMLCAETEMSEGVGKNYMAPPTYKMIGQFFRQIAQVIPIKRSILFCIIQDTSNVSGYGKKYNEKMPNALRYQANYKLRINKSEIVVDTSGNPIGLKPTWICSHSPLTGPGRTIEGRITFGVGIDAVAETVALSLNLPNTISKKGAGWFTLDLLADDEGNAPKVQGEQGVIDYFRENPEHYDKLKITVDSYLR